MRVSCICVCHDKPDVAHEAIGSIVRQTHTDWEALVVDSGVLYDRGYYDRFAWRSDPRIRLIRSDETEAMRRTTAMAPWCFNNCFRKGWVKGQLVVYLCDDDLLYPNAFATFVAYCRDNPDAMAMYASQDVGVVYPNGWRAIIGERRADGFGGRSCDGRRMDCEVDYLQFCHRAEVLKRLAGDEYWPEAKCTEEHADGIFMERIGAMVPVHPIDVKVAQNRRTPRSLNIPMTSLSLMDCMANGIPLLPGLEQCSAPRVAADELPLVSVVLTESHNKSVHEALMAQTYPRIETITVEDNSRESSARDHALRSARGDFLLQLGPDQLPVPDAIERLVSRMRCNPNLSAVTCYLLGIAERGSLASVKNVTASALFRTADLRAVGGFDSNSDAASAEWSTFLKLVNAGRRVDILPEHLFWKTRDDCDSPGNALLKPFVAMDRVLASEREALWKAMAGYERRLDELVRDKAHLQARLELLRYRIADRVHAALARVPFLLRGLKWVFRSIAKMFQGTPAVKSQNPDVANQSAASWPMAKNAAAAP